MTPVEAALLHLSRDLRNILRIAAVLRRQGEALESFACAAEADLDRLAVEFAVERKEFTDNASLDIRSIRP